MFLSQKLLNDINLISFFLNKLQMQDLFSVLRIIFLNWYFISIQRISIFSNYSSYLLHCYANSNFLIVSFVSIRQNTHFIESGLISKKPEFTLLHFYKAFINCSQVGGAFLDIILSYVSFKITMIFCYSSFTLTCLKSMNKLHIHMALVINMKQIFFST